MQQNRARILRQSFRALVLLRIVSDRRAGILPKRNAMSKRKFHEAESHAPHTMHSFSTVPAGAKNFQKTRFTSHPKGLETERTKRKSPRFSTGVISTSASEITAARAPAIAFREGRSRKFRACLRRSGADCAQPKLRPVRGARRPESKFDTWRGDCRPRRNAQAGRRWRSTLPASADRRQERGSPAWLSRWCRPARW